MTVSSSITLEVIDLSLDTKEVASSNHGKDEDVVVQLVTDVVSKCDVFDASKDVSDAPPILSTSRSLLQSFKRFGVNSSRQVEEEKEKIVKSVARFLKVNDRYTALTSLLLKSYLYHTLTVESLSAKESEIVERRNKIKRVTTLPKTEKGRPFMPSIDISFSISHQYPFVGMAYMKDKSAERIPREHEHPLIGLDIVMFTSYRDTQHLYNGVEEFIEVFRDSFSPNEWNEIESIDCPNKEVETNPRLIEFFLRWSVKEAYTKALGLGMSLDFKSFHTQMYQNFENQIPVTYLWKSFLKSENPFTFMAKVKYNGKHDEETWQFSFLPLGFRKGNASGAACICLSPKDRQITKPFPDVDVTYKSLQELISFHTGS